MLPIIDDISDSTEYQYKLENYNNNWSTWSKLDSVVYELPNGIYNFMIQAKDEAGNIGAVIKQYNFAVNANPKISSFERSNRGVWASTVEIEMPQSTFSPTRNVILTSEYSSITDMELIPLRVYKMAEDNCIGVNEIISSKVSDSTIIFEKGDHYLFRLPDTLLAGEKVEIVIEWGKAVYFGWKEPVKINHKFNDLNIISGYSGGLQACKLIDDTSTFYYAYKKRSRIITYGTTMLWQYIDKVKDNQSLVKNNQFDLLPGVPFDGTLGYEYNSSNSGAYNIIPIGDSVLVLYSETRYEKNSSGYEDYARLVARIFNKYGDLVNELKGNWEIGFFYQFPKQLINDKIVVAGTKDSKEIWYEIYDLKFNKILSRTTIISVSINRLQLKKVFPIGNELLFVWQRWWSTPNGDDRRIIQSQVRDYSGILTVQTSTITTDFLPDATNKDDEYHITSSIIDRKGIVWMIFERSTDYESDRYYRIAIKSDKSIHKSLTLTHQDRQLLYNDRDNYIWQSYYDNNQYKCSIIDENENNILNPRDGFLTPNQDFNSVSARSGYTSYQIFDRWNPIEFEIEAPNIVIDSMELFDLDIWNNDFHPSNIEIVANNNVLFQNSGKYTSYNKFNVSGKINQGSNILKLSQTDVLGGQLLINFPINPVYNCICGKVTLNDTSQKVTDVLVSISGDFNKTLNPDNLGLYCFDSLVKGNYNVRADLNNFEFSPLSYTFSDLSESYYDKDFDGNLKYYSICGKVTLNDTSQKVTYVSLSMTGDQNKTKKPDLIGLYCFDSLVKGNYEITANLNNYDFTPSSWSFSDLSENQNNKDFHGIKQPDNIDRFERNFINIYPNPTSGNLYITAYNKLHLVEIYNIFGEKLYSNHYQNSINVSTYPSGIYILRILDFDYQVLQIAKVIKN